MIKALCIAIAGLLAGAAPVAAQAILAPSLAVDTRFAPPDGIARVDLAGNLTDIPSAVAVDGDRIYTVGEARDSASDSNVAVVAHRLNGQLDTGFSGDGKLTIPVAADTGKDVGVSVVVLPGGALRVLASTDVTAGSGTNIDVAVIGLLPDGGFDTSFGGGTGKVIFPVGANDETPTRLALGPDGRLAVSGARRDASSKEDSFVALLEADGAPVAGFGTNGVRILDRAGPTLNDRAVDVVFRPGGGLLALIQNETNPDAAVNDYQAVLHAFDLAGGDDLSFSGDGDMVLEVGEPDTIPGGLIVHDGRLWSVGATRIGQDTDAFLARMQPDGSGFESRRFDVRGTAIGADQVVTSSASELAVVPGNPLTLVVTGSINFGSRPYWAAAAFNGLDRPLANMNFGDTIIATEEYGAVVGAAAGGDGWVALAGSLVDTSSNFDTTFGTARLLVDADKACDATVDVPVPLEIGIAPGGSAPVVVEVRNPGSRPCSGTVSVGPEYVLRRGGVAGPLSFTDIGPGGSLRVEADLSYTGPRRFEDTVTFTVAAAGDSKPGNDARRVHVLFDFCDLQMEGIELPEWVPVEGGTRAELEITNVGTRDCRDLEVDVAAGGRRVGRPDRFTLRRGRSASETIRVGAPPGAQPGTQAELELVPRAERVANEGDDALAVTATVAPVGDSRIRRAGALAVSGRAKRAKGKLLGKRARLRRVEVAIVRKVRGKGCRWARKSGKLSRRSCRRPLWIRARGARSWHLRLRRSLPAGRYTVRSRAVIRAGFAEARFSKGDRNKRVIRVR